MSTLPRYRPMRRLRPVGRRAASLAPSRTLVYAAVAQRAKGLCELCGRPQDPLDPHHTFGRGHLPGVPTAVCETAELILGVCRWCHNAIHSGDEVIGDEARRIAMVRFISRHRLDGPELCEEPLEAMRRLVRELEARAGT